MSVIFSMLMCTVSLTFPETMVMIVHNQYPDIKLVSPVYLCNHGTYYTYPVRKTNAGTMMEIEFRSDPDQNKIDGILMYKMQRKRKTRSNHRSIIDKVIEEASKMMRLLVIWRIECSGEPKVNIMLIEYNNEFVLNEDRLAQFYEEVNDIPSGYDLPICTWLVCNNTVLKVEYRLVRKAVLESNIIIYKGAEDKHTMKPIWIDSTRQVSLLMVIYVMLIYIVSFTLQSAIDLTINNQCTDIELISPIYFIKDAKCYIQFPQQVNEKSIMRTNFITDINRSTFGGALLYHLQRKANTSISVQLLVIWGSTSDRIYSHVYLIKHESTHDWDKDKLKRLYDVYNSQYKMCFIQEKYWLLDDNMLLRTVCETSREGFEIEIIIYEEKYPFHPMKSLWVDPNR
jgi:hypothetical protein